MQPHQQRVVAEKAELDSKIEKLNTFIASDKIQSVSEQEQYLLGAQSVAMLRYSEILGERIANF